MLRHSALLIVALCLAADSFAQQQVRRVLGTQGFDEFGSAVANAGDANGDGINDMIVGASRSSIAGTNAGYARIVSGADGSTIHTLFGASPTDSFGLSVDGVGDVNGDGKSDVIVGAHYDSAALPNSGSARVHSGLDGSVIYTLIGQAAADFPGTVVCGLGDISGDGVPDFAMGEYFNDEFAPDAGKVWVYSGATGTLIRTHTGDQLGDRYGESLASAGDVDGDGTRDYVTGGRRISGSLLGAARVYSGATGATLHTFQGTATGNAFGLQVAGAGDVNNDGYDDVIVGAMLDATAGPAQAGMARVFSGLDGSVLHTFYGSVTAEQLGRAVSGAGDANGDGFDDVLVGMDKGSFAGTGQARVYSGADGSILYTLRSLIPNDAFGVAVNQLGDIDGDGLVDWAVGAYGADQPFMSAGAVHVFSLKLPFVNYCNSTSNSTGAPGQIGATGYGSHSANNLVLLGSNMPSSSPCLFFYGTNQGSTPYGNGVMCVSGQVFRLGPALFADGLGRVSRPLNLTVAPANFGAGQISVGSTWNFQLVFRDSTAGPAFFNTTGGMSVTFVP